MSDIVSEPISTATHDWSSEAAKKRVKARYGRDTRLQMLGLGAIGFAVVLLGILVASLISTGYVAFYTTKVNLSVFLDPKLIDKNDPGKANYRLITKKAWLSHFPEVTNKREQTQLYKILSSGAAYIIRNHAINNPDEVGKLINVRVPLSDPFDQLHKGVIPKKIDALTYDKIARFTTLQRRGVISEVDGKTHIQLDAFIDPKAVGDKPEDGDYLTIVKEAMKAMFPRQADTSYQEILDDSAADTLKEFAIANPENVGKTVQIKLPVFAPYDELNKTGESKILNPRFASEKVLGWYDQIVNKGMISSPFTWEIFLNSDSRFPEQAGLAGAITGSFFALLVCFLISFPMGIAAAVYLEEFAPKNKLTDFIEVNINNLAAVPSVVFGLLGLAIFLNTFGLPRSAPLVGGMVLSLMTLPTIIIATRAALKGVPPSIREAALGIGASKHQVILHHVLPLAMPGILTGTIIGLAQALGETAPLLLIGMNAFIPSIENLGILQPATSLPTQIYSWADSPERGFVSRTSAAILVLLGFLLVMNAIAIFLRQRFERKW